MREDIEKFLKVEEAKGTFILCDMCGKTKGAHELRIRATCRDFSPLATFAQLKKAWELVDAVSKLSLGSPSGDMKKLEVIVNSARRIRGGEKWGE